MSSNPAEQTSQDLHPIATEGNQDVLALHEEKLSVGKRVRTTRVRAKRVTQTRIVSAQAELTHELVTVERVPINKIVPEIPPVREEGDLIVLPVIEEIVVVERRLVLKEEVHIRRVRRVETYCEPVEVRAQKIVVTRIELDAKPANHTQEHMA